VARPETLQEFIDAFADLKICETPEQATALNAFITKLYEKSPKMLGKILGNCQ
jgi:hypothetical protein